jgi:acetyl esterase
MAHSLKVPAMADVDPKTRTLLDMIAALGAPPLSETRVEDYRAMRERGRSLVNTPTAPIDVVEDIHVAGAEGPLRARVYDCAQGAMRPTLIYFHGGGFVYGDLDSHDAICRRLANAGDLRVISVEYRLAPEHPFPAAPEDAWAALNDIVARADDLGVDAARLGVGGDSAGGNLAAVTARRAARGGRIKLRHQLLIYPVTQCIATTPSRDKFAEGYFLTRESMDWFDGFYMPPGADRQDERASPLLAPPPEGLAPALVITAGFDPLLDEGRDYAKLLKDAGVACDHVDYDDQIHGFFSFTAFSTRAERAIEDAARAVRRALT